MTGRSGAPRAGLEYRMDNLIGRHRNLTILVAVIFSQVLGLAIQVKRSSDAGSERLIRVWTVAAIAPVEKLIVGFNQALRNGWLHYVDLRGVRAENRALRDQVNRLHLEQARLEQDAAQGRRLEALLKFKQQFIGDTVAARVIGYSGSRHSRVFYLDKGADYGLQPDMAVITPGGIVGKVILVLGNTAQVLEIRDPDSGVGVVLEKSRLRSVLKGTPDGRMVLRYVMADENVELGERLLTSGGDRVFPRGLPVGTIVSVTQGSDTFLSIRVKPAADLDRLDEVLVVTRIAEVAPDPQDAEPPRRAADILAQRLPTIPTKSGAEAASPARGKHPAGPATEAAQVPPSPADGAPSQQKVAPATPPPSQTPPPGGALR